MPLSAMIARDEIMDWPAGAHGSTFGGNPVCCAAAHATLDVIEEHGLMANASRVGGQLLDNLRDLAAESYLLGDVRGLGLMVAVELVQDRETKKAAKHQAEAVVQACFRRGLLLLPCGPSSIRFSPPLTITPQEADTAFAIFAEALTEVEGR
jgi:4-aminobutyrate aminotransferase